jgi:hypothetical protein
MTKHRITRGWATIAELVDQGWTISHSALCATYRYAGSVSAMQTRKGREYCRVHHGKTVGVHTWQVTTVMTRPARKEA